MRGLIYHGTLLINEHRRRLTILGLILAITALGVRLSHGQTIANALDQVNAKRASLGLYPLMPDARLQAAAECDASWRAYRGVGGHMKSTPMVGRAEGVGWHDGADPYGEHFHTCFHTSDRRHPPYTTTHQYAGAAAAVCRGRTYFTLELR